MLTLSFQVIQDPYLSPLSPSFFSYSDSSPPNASPTLLEYQSMNTYPPIPYDDINWPALGEVSDEASSNFPDVSPMGLSQYPNHYESSFTKSSDHLSIYLEKITEFEKWDSFPPVQIETEIREVPTGRLYVFFLLLPRSLYQWSSIGSCRHSS